MTPIAEVPSGHAVVKDDGSIQTAAYVLHKWTPMPTEGPDWRLVERGAEKPQQDEEPYGLRRRVREKTPRDKL